MAPGEAARTCRRLAGARYATGGWSVGAVALVASWLARTEPRHHRITAIFPDDPHRYFGIVHDDERQGRGCSGFAPRPCQVVALLRDLHRADHQPQALAAGQLVVECHRPALA